MISSWQELVDAFDPAVVGSDVATRNRFVAAGAGVMALAVGVYLWSTGQEKQIRQPHKGVSVRLELLAAHHAWLTENTERHGLTDLSRAVRMAVDYAMQEANIAQVFSEQRIAAKAQFEAIAEKEIVLDRVQLDWLDQVTADKGLTSRSEALAIILSYAQTAENVLVFLIDRSKTRGPRTPSVRFTIKS